MSEAAAHPSPVLPFNDPSRSSRLKKVAGWLIGIALVVVVLNLLGVDVVGWLKELWDEIKDIPAGYIVLLGWRRELQGGATAPAPVPATESVA